MLYIVRGLPGSGKSTFAKKLGVPHFEADMYHINEKGEYDWKPENVVEAHSWCRQSVHDELLTGGPVVVSNTFTRIWEMEPYLKMDDNVLVFKCTNEFQNTHNIPSEAIRKMRDRWESFEGEYLIRLASRGLSFIVE